MKKLLILMLAVTVFAANSNGQNINWRSLQEQKYVASVNFGMDYGTIVGVGFGYQFKTRLLPIMANAEFSLPAGDKIFDDFKLKVGGQAEVLHLGNFSTTVRAYGIIRQYQNSLTTITNYGSEFSAIAGFYKSKWYAAGEFGFDKAITSHIRNSETMKGHFPGVKDGWYVPTGGNFFYGIQSGFSFGKMDINLKVGKTIAQGFKTSAYMPVYLQIGVNKRF